MRYVYDYTHYRHRDPLVRDRLPPFPRFPAYQPHNEKLLSKLHEYHPDLPSHILTCHYSSLLAPVAPTDLLPTDLDRVETSVLAVACLRALGGVEKQVESHIFGLRKAHERGAKDAKGAEEWITTDEGCVWLLRVVDEVVKLFSRSER
jgi:hypothetical protein